MAESLEHTSSALLPGPAGSRCRAGTADAGQNKTSQGTYQGAGVGRVGRIILQIAREAKVRHFAHQVAVDQDVPGSQISVHIIHLCKVLHPSSNSSEHPHQLDHCELPIILLQSERAGTGVSIQTPELLSPILGGCCTSTEDYPPALTD